MPPGTLLTDAGSTKAAIVRGIEGRLPAGVAFVGSHPLAGSEKRGPSHADADLFQDRLTVVTPTPQTDPGRGGADQCLLASARRAGSGRWSPEEHDRALALTSHLPHLVASALAGILPPELHDLTATGFRDTTRIAAGDPELWTAIFLQNRELHARSRSVELQDRLDEFRRCALMSRRLGNARRTAGPSQEGTRCSGKLKSGRRGTTRNGERVAPGITTC